MYRDRQQYTAEIPGLLALVIILLVIVAQKRHIFCYLESGCKFKEIFFKSVQKLIKFVIGL